MAALALALAIFAMGVAAEDAKRIGAELVTAGAVRFVGFLLLLFFFIWGRGSGFAPLQGRAPSSFTAS